MSIKGSTRNVLLAAAVAAALPVPTLAQTGPVALGEIVVTARKREERLQDVPLSVTAISGAALEESGVQDLVAIAQSVPNVTLEASRATNSTLTAFIRGIGQQDPVAGYEGGVGIYLDDVFLARPQGTVFDIYDVERIEVLRGPQGTLYGRNTIGGAVKYVTKRLADEPMLNIKLSGGTYGQADVVLTGSMPLGDTFRIGATAARFNRDGFGKNLVTGAPQYDKDILAARVSMEWMPTDSLSVRLSGDHSDDDSANKDGHRLTVSNVTRAPILGNVYNSRGGIMAVPSSNRGLVQSVRQFGGSLVIDWQASDRWAFKSVTAYREDASDAPIDFDSLPSANLDVPAVYENDQTSQEFQLNYNGDRMTGVFGAYYLDANAFDAFDVIISSGAATAYTYGDFDTKAWAVFGDLSYDLSEVFNLSVGGRYTSDERDAVVIRQTFFGRAGSPYSFERGQVTPLPGAITFAGKRKDTDFSPRVSLGMKSTDGQNFYLSYSQGFKGGSFDPRGAYQFPEVRAGFNPETVDTYEVGLKSNWAEGRYRTNVAMFYSDYKDVQVPGSVAIDTNNDGINDSFAGSTTNAAAATIRGFEVEAIAQFSDAFSMTAAFGFIDAEYEKWLVSIAGRLTDVSSQRGFQNTPKRTGNVSARYAWPLSMFGSSGDLAFITALTFRDDTQQFETPSIIDQEAYWLADASLVWTSSDQRIQAGVHGKNLNDARYKIAGYLFPTLGSEGTVTAFYGNPMTVTGTVSFRF